MYIQFWAMIWEAGPSLGSTWWWTIGGGPFCLSYGLTTSTTSLFGALAGVGNNDHSDSCCCCNIFLVYIDPAHSLFTNYRVHVTDMMSVICKMEALVLYLTVLCYNLYFYLILVALVSLTEDDYYGSVLKITRVGSCFTASSALSHQVATSRTKD